METIKYNQICDSSKRLFKLCEVKFYLEFKAFNSVLLFLTDKGLNLIFKQSRFALSNFKSRIVLKQFNFYLNAMPSKYILISLNEINFLLIKISRDFI